jgi:hypothetical protein
LVYLSVFYFYLKFYIWLNLILDLIMFILLYLVHSRLNFWIISEIKFKFDCRSFIYYYGYFVLIAGLLLLLAMIGAISLTVDSECEWIVTSKLGHIIKRNVWWHIYLTEDFNVVDVWICWLTLALYIWRARIWGIFLSFYILWFNLYALFF